MKSYFPIKIRYIKDNKVFIINNPKEIKSGKSFKVLEIIKGGSYEN